MVYWKINGYKQKKVIWKAGNKEQQGTKLQEEHQQEEKGEMKENEKTVVVRNNVSVTGETKKRKGRKTKGTHE